MIVSERGASFSSLFSLRVSIVCMTLGTGWQIALTAKEDDDVRIPSWQNFNITGSTPDQSNAFPIVHVICASRTA